MRVILFIAISISLETESLVVQVQVPRKAEQGGRAVLRCSHNTALSNIYSVKWYKDESEFCRIYPAAESPEIFPAPGIQVEKEDCFNTTVKLKGLSKESSGYYKCEITAGPPQFQSVISGDTMSVVAYPSGEPHISGVLPIYRTGQYVSALCVSSPSDPPARLTWYINGHPAESWLMYQYPPEETEVGLFKASMGLRFQADRGRFGPTGIASLLCSSTVGSLPPWQASVTVALYPDQTYGRYRGAASLHKLSRILMGLLFLINKLQFS